MQWHKVELTPQQFQHDDHVRIRDEFREIWVSPSAIDDYFEMALLESRPNPDFSLTLYFSPVAARHCAALIARYNGTACAPPPPGTPIALGDDSFQTRL
jgi:hypothetical protein